MKKIIATFMALLTIGGPQVSALNKNTIKKAVSKVSSKIIPAAAVTLGVGVLAKKIVKIYNEKRAYEDGIRYIKWHSYMCWFNASILYLYYHDYYRDYLYNLKEDTYKEDDEFPKKVTVELSRLIKKIKNSPTCMCELTEEDYNRILSLYDNPDFTFGKCGGEMSLMFTEAIKYYDLKRASSEEHIENEARSTSVVYERGHFYVLYYDKNTNRLYTIGRGTDSLFACSIKVLCPGSKEYNMMLENLKNNKVIIDLLVCRFGISESTNFF